MPPRYAPAISFSKICIPGLPLFASSARSNALTAILSKPPDSALMIIAPPGSSPAAFVMFAFCSTYAQLVPVPRMKPM